MIIASVGEPYVRVSREGIFIEGKRIEALRND
jgi:hypothetical protein